MHALLKVGVLPAMVTPIVDPAVGFSHVPSDISCAPGSHDVDRELDSAGGGSSY